MHKKRCGPENFWGAIQIVPHLNILNPDDLGEILKAWNTLEHFQKRPVRAAWILTGACVRNGYLAKNCATDLAQKWCLLLYVKHPGSQNWILRYS